MKHLKKFIDYIFEGIAEKAVRVKDKNKDTNPSRKENFRKKIADYTKSHGCKSRQIGDDLEISLDGDRLLQAMFRNDYVGIKKEGGKFTKKFNFNEFGKIKAELSDIIKSKK